VTPAMGSIVSAGYVATSVTDAVGGRSHTPYCTGIERLSHAGRATIALAFAREGASVIGCNVIVEPAESSVGVVRVVGIPKSSAPVDSEARTARASRRRAHRERGRWSRRRHMIVRRAVLIEVFALAAGGANFPT
jgi:hypothetical protein